MDQSQVLHIVEQALWLTVLLSAPVVLAALAVGLVVSLFQAATQIQEQTLSIAPKIIVVYATIAALGAWALPELVEYTRELLHCIAQVRG
jgi:flagellar biosynthetic protein FliQ